METNTINKLSYKYMYSCNQYRTISRWNLFSEENCQLIELARFEGKDFIKVKLRENYPIKVNLKTMKIESKELNGEIVKRVPELK
jgi:hypothetical protein